MILKLVLMLKDAGMLVQDIPTSNETLEEDVAFLDSVMDDIFEAMNTRSIIRFTDARLKNFIANGEFIIGCQYLLAADDTPQNNNAYTEEVTEVKEVE